jgi:hypothetical protein
MTQLLIKAVILQKSTYVSISLSESNDCLVFGDPIRLPN